ncbi:MAG: DNA repair protein RecN [Deltaproteobacteria bacterium]|nr:DNA repair protein RecN [Deltaproteobacteria bacterium]
MLIELSVRNLAIFEDVRVPFAAGLNVVTGETGAGKSILVEAIRLALGEKADPVAVRSGEAEAEVSALFDLSGREDLREAWEEAGFPWEEELVLRRVIPSAGRSRAYFNGRMAAQSALVELSPPLVEMVGQHSIPFLLSRAAALAVIDEFSGSVAQAQEARRRFRRVCALRRQAEEAAARGAGARGRIETLDFQVAELSKASLAPGEEEELAVAHAVLRNASKVQAALRDAESALSSSEHSAAASLSFAAARTREAAAVDPRLGDLFERIRSLQNEAQDLSRDLISRAGKVTVEADRRDQIEERLTEIRRLKRKYGKEVPDLIAHLAELKAERAGLDSALEEERRLREALEAEEEACVRAAVALSGRRGSEAKKMAAAVEKELSLVALGGAKFRAEISSREPAPASLAASGLDEAELLFCANPGQELRPLSQTASGGELSRVMLALRNASSRGKGGRTMVFDEIDTGIGGRVAERVGARLKELGRAAQVICVTHLPQVAAFADSHLLVCKAAGKGTVTTCVKPLAKQDRIMELARMISGAEVTGEARAHARDLIERAAGG